MGHTHDRRAPARRWRAWLAGASLWLGLAAAAWAQTSVSLPGGTLSTGIVGDAYTDGVSATGGVAPYTYAVIGSLPPGLSLDSTSGAISGIPSAAGYFSFSIKADDSASGTAVGAYDITIVVPPSLEPATLPDTVVGERYTQYMYVDNGSGPYHFTITSGSLPPGLSLDLGGTLSGKATTAGDYTFKITAAPVPSLLPEATFPFSSVTRSYTIGVAPPTIDIAPPGPNLTATTYVPYSQAFTASGGTAPYTFSANVPLPDGLVLDPTGVISGTPTHSGVTGFTLTATDANGATGTGNYSLVVEPPTIAIAPPSLPDGRVGSAYAQSLSASGGVAPYTWDLVSGSLPAGLAFDAATGAISGTPTEDGSTSFAVVAIDANGETGTQSYVFTVQPPIISLSPTTLPGGTVGAAYGVTVTALGGTAPYAFTLGSGALPPGLSLAAASTEAASITGTPTKAGSYDFVLLATDANGHAGDEAYSVVVADATVTITLSPASLPDGQVGVAYAQAVSASGGTAPYAFAVSGGTLPPGLALSSSGVLSGSPTAAGSYTFAVSATDNLGNTGSNGYQVQVTALTVTLAPASLPDGAVGTTYSQAISASGGTGPYNYAVASGALPPGIALASDGTLGGMPTEAGSYAFAVSATDSFGNHGSADYVLHVGAPAITLSPASLPDGQVGAAYSQALAASGGTAPYAYAVTGGELPAGLALSTGGALSGTPTESGSHAFTVTATDAHGDTGTQSWTLAIAEAATPPPGAGAHQAMTPAGTPVQVDLTEGATGGPFTGADVLSLSPANAGGTAVAQSAAGAYVLTFTPAQGFTGTATVLYTLSNAGGDSSAGTVTIQVTPVADPLRDADVTGLVQSQTTISEVFAQTQVTNLVGRLDSLQGPRLQPWGFWVAGSFRRGDLDANGNAEGLTFETSGVTTGADRQFGDSFSFGLAGGLAQDRTLVGHRGSRNDSRAHAAAGYGSFHPSSSPFFVNVMHGHQRLSFQLRRFSPSGGAAAAGAGGAGAQALAASIQPLAADDGDLLDSERTGGQDFSSLGAGYRYKAKAWTFTSYGRQDDVRTRLDAYTEPSNVPGALHYDAQSMRTRTSILGLRIDGTREIRWGTLLPKFKVELQGDNDDQGEVAVRYADEPDGPVFRTRPRNMDNRRVAMEVGATLVTRHFLTLRLEYHAVLGGLFGNDNALVFSFEKEH
jgi:hypothetical protein